MQFSQRPWSDLRSEINRNLSNCGMTPSELAAISGINYYSARRMLVSGVQNRTENAQKVANALLSPAKEPGVGEPKDSLDELVARIVAHIGGNDQQKHMLRDIVTAIATHQSNP